jgi:hypothetical protein
MQKTSHTEKSYAPKHLKNLHAEFGSSIAYWWDKTW